MTEHEYKLQLEFDSDDPQFVRGIEIGMLYTQVEFMVVTGAVRFSRPIHANNLEMALRIAEALNVRIRSEEIDYEWVNIIYESADCEEPA